jgi:hypothetical protein
MDRNPSATAARLMRRLKRLGPEPVCVLCGYSNPFGLIPVKRKVLEDHHVVLKVHDSRLIVPICRNCHAEITERLQQEGISPYFEPDSGKRVALMLVALAVFFELLAPALRRWADSLKEKTNEKQHLPSSTY